MSLDDSKVLVQHPAKTEFTLKRIPWSRRMWLLIRGKLSRKNVQIEAPPINKFAA
jgi:hypothetical protein